MINGMAIAICYLIGSLSFSLIVGKIKGIDIRKHGSGNAGATNTLRVLGIVPAIIVFVLDMGKGIASVLIGSWLSQGTLWVTAACGLAAIIGHNWPVFFSFRGGKGIATTIGVTAVLSFYPAAIAGAVAIISIFITRYVSLGSLIFTTLMPIIAVIMGAEIEIIIAMLLICAFAVYRHRSNIRRLIRGEEHKIGSKR
ncbi:glycerol-3-phosphate acyltransferase [Insulibacter thermoxylanivorax]|uniref:Glycerol-3-phosphate acyltransferase n=2 Tax=Insulibacter thermoxylanivorax TaxID=2749268 RepID=A0A916Q9W0_9BACL|nr:glycerol-3-phosphate acyltransferase [Insulibacter thermoxylanivorax]